jgi:IS5 family transposase
VIRARAPKAKDFTNRRYRGLGWFNETEKMKNRTKSQVRAKVEHAIGVIKRVFGFQKVRYRGLAKNLHRLEVTAALANLFLVRRRLLVNGLRDFPSLVVRFPHPVESCCFRAVSERARP